ncbi:MAG TPA: hypothetical protein VMV44_06270 [Rectinemataceae bacterium]|nr:hypothetical protein [Rectinemataceae bacterium]
MRRFLVGTLVTLGLIVLAIALEGGNLLKLFLPSPLLIAFAAPLCAVLAVWDTKAWGKAWKDAFSPAPDERRRAASARLWNFLEKAFYLSGILAFIAGSMIVLTNAGDYAEYFSVDLVAPLWTMAFALVTRILRYRVLTRGD